VAFGALRKEVAEKYGEFLRAQHFRETYYDYSEKSFGNEILDFNNNNKTTIRFVRDRSQVLIDLKNGDTPYQPIHVLLAQLGLFASEPPSDWTPQHGWLFGAEYLISEWPRLVALLP